MNFQMGSFYLNMSLFFVYVALFPDAEFLLFFIIPIKAKWLGIIEGAYFAITIAAGFIVPVGALCGFPFCRQVLWRFRLTVFQRCYRF